MSASVDTAPVPTARATPATAAAPAAVLAAAAAATCALAAINDRLRADDERARRLLRMSVLLIGDTDQRSRHASDRFMAEAFACGATAVDAFLEAAAASGHIRTIHLRADGAFAHDQRAAERLQRFGGSPARSTSS